MATTRARGGFRYIGTRKVAAYDVGSTLTLAEDVATTVEISGARVSDVAAVTLATQTAGIIVDAYVSSAGVVTLRSMNVTAGTINPTASEAVVTVFRPL